MNELNEFILRGMNTSIPIITRELEKNINGIEITAALIVTKVVSVIVFIPFKL